MQDRFGFDAPKDLPIEKSIEWAAQNGFKFIDFNADNPPNDIASFDKARASKVRDLLEESEIQLGVHPVSAINNAEYVPVMSEAVDDYLNANLQLTEAKFGVAKVIAAVADDPARNPLHPSQRGRAPCTSASLQEGDK
jgi:sugar phosphate isomerase/epimerase